MKKTVLALSLMMGICSASSAFAALPQSIRIGTDATYAPFSSKDAKGDFVGFDIDLGNELCSRIKVKCTWVGSDFVSLIPSLKAKKIDAIISSPDCRQRLADSANAGIAERQACRRASGLYPGGLW